MHPGGSLWAQNVIENLLKNQLFTLRASRRGRFACGGNAATRPEGEVGMELEFELELELELEWN